MSSPRGLSPCEIDGHNWVVDETKTEDGIVVLTHCSVCGAEWSE